VVRTRRRCLPVVRIITMMILRIYVRAYETIFFCSRPLRHPPPPEHHIIIIITYMVYNIIYGVCYYIKSMNFFFKKSSGCSNVRCAPTHTMRPIKGMSNKRRKNNIIVINDPQWRGMRVCVCVSVLMRFSRTTTYYWKVKFQGSLAISDPGSQYARACVTRLPVYNKCTE